MLLAYLVLGALHCFATQAEFIGVLKMTVAFQMGLSFSQRTPIYCCVFDFLSLGHMGVTLEARTLATVEKLTDGEHTD